jgi:hypothetical protein
MRKSVKDYFRPLEKVALVLGVLFIIYMIAVVVGR